MIQLIVERYYNTINKMFYEIRPLYMIKKTYYEIYYRYNDDSEWIYETTKNSKEAAKKYIKQKGV